MNLIKIISTIACCTLSYFNTISAQQASNKTIISIYTSSQGGDRLTKKKNIFFISGKRTSSPQIHIDEDSIYQKMDGFGATFNEAGMICLNALSQTDQKNVFMALFDSVQGAGFTFMKSPISACDFASAGPWYTYDDYPEDTLLDHFSIKRDLEPDGLITFIKKAAQYGKFKIESPMDFAPDWMYFSLKKGEKHIKPEYYNTLARYYSKYLRSYEDHGVHIDFLNLFNEAHNEWYSNVTYNEIAELITKHVAPQLKKDGISTPIQFGETSNRPEAIQKFPEALKDDEVIKNIHSLTVHGYDWNKFSTLTQLHDRYPNLPIYQTEVCYAMPGNVPPGGPKKLPVYDFSDGEFWGNMIVNDLKNWVSGWIYWNMILDQNGGPWLISVEHGDPDHNNQHPVVIIDRKTKKVYYTGLYYYLSHFSKFVRPGAYRIKTSGNTNDLNYVGFRNPDGSIVLNVVNNRKETLCSVSWHNKIAALKLPAHSITTLKWKN